MWHKFVAILVLWTVIVLYVHFKTEKFEDVGASNAELKYENTDALPWNHYDVHNSIIDDVNIKYKNAYYFEYPNAEYEKALKNTFQLQCSSLAIANALDDWTGPYDPSKLSDSMQQAYDKWLEKLVDMLRASEYLRIVSDASEDTNIQVVHDRWMMAYIHRTLPNTLRIDMEVILYRTGKPHGKHVRMSVLAQLKDNMQWKYEVAAVEIVGIVPEDQIAMHPVVASNPFDTGEMKYLDDPRTFANQIIPNEKEVLNLLNQQFALNKKYAESQLIMHR